MGGRLSVCLAGWFVVGKSRHIWARERERDAAAAALSALSGPRVLSIIPIFSRWRLGASKRKLIFNQKLLSKIFSRAAAIDVGRTDHAQIMSSLLLASTLAHAASLGEWKRVNDKDLICTSAEYNGHLGDMDTAESCKNAVAALSPQLNSYAVWRGDTPRSGCHVCNLTGRGAPDTWTLTERVGAVSFLLSADDQRWKAQWEEDARIVGMAARVHKQVVAESRNVAAIAVRANRSLQRTLAVVRPANNNQTSYAGWRPTRHWTWTSGTIPLRYDIFSLVNLTWSWLTGNGAPPGGGEGIVVAPARRRQLATHHHKDACCDAWVARGPAALVRCHELRNRTMPSILSLTNSSMALVSLSVDARAVVATGRDARPFDDRLAVSDFAQAHGLAHLTPRECMDEEDLAGLSWISPSWARVYVLSACRAAHPQVERFVWLDALSLPPRLPSVTRALLQIVR